MHRAYELWRQGLAPLELDLEWTGCEGQVGNSKSQGDGDDLDYDDDDGVVLSLRSQETGRNALTFDSVCFRLPFLTSQTMKNQE